MKKPLKIIISAVAAVALLTTGIGGYAIYKKANTKVEVFPVSYISTSPWGYDESSYGIVTTDMTQDVYISENQVIQEVFVQEGDMVDVGTPLVQLDNTLANLDLEMQDLAIDNIDLQIDSVERDIYFLKNASPVRKEPLEETTGEMEVSIREIPHVLVSSPNAGGTGPDIQNPGNGSGIYEGENPYDGILPTGREAKLKEKKNELTKLNIDRKEAVLTYEKMRREVSSGTILSTVKGQVKSVAGLESGFDRTSPFITVTSQEGFYLRGTINELKLEQVSVGQTVSVTSMETGMSAEAEITSISKFPVSDNANAYGTNPNTSNYPFTAYLTNAEGFKNNQSVNITIQSDGESLDSGVYIPIAYIREDGGESYVYIAGENGRLKKQIVKTGAMLYGYYQEIKSGLTSEDLITFPYGKNVKEGVKTIETDTPSVY